MKKILSVIVLAIIFVCSQNNLVNAQDYNFTQFTTGATFEAVVDSDIDYLALRSGPSTDYREILRIPPGAHIIIYTRGEIYQNNRSGNRFIAASYQGTDGYVSERYFTVLRLVESY